MVTTVREIALLYRLDRVAWRDTFKGRQRALTWQSLPLSARLTLLAWTTRQPDGWISLLAYVSQTTGADRLVHLHAIKPLIACGWAVRAPTGHEVWLTLEGRGARQMLRLALGALADRENRAP